MGGGPAHPPQPEHLLIAGPQRGMQGHGDAGTWGPRAGAQYPQQEGPHWTGACSAGGVRTPTPFPQCREVLKVMLSLAPLQGAPPENEPRHQPRVGGNLWRVHRGARRR